MTKPKKMGRPTKYQADFHPVDYIALCEKGYSQAQVCAAWSIDGDTLVEWTKKFPEFSAACKIGRKKKEAWYTNFGMMMAAGKVKGGNVAAWIWLSKQVCGWQDRIAIESDGDLEVTFSDGDDKVA